MSTTSNRYGRGFPTIFRPSQYSPFQTLLNLIYYFLICGIFPFSLRLEYCVDHLSTAVHAHLLVDVVDVVLDRIVGNKQQAFDLLVAFSLQDELHDLSLPFGYLFVLSKDFQESRAVF